MARPNSESTPHVSDQSAEVRAVKAERRVEELEHRIEALESTSFQRAPHYAPTSVPNPENANNEQGENNEITGLRQEPMMDHLLNSLSDGQDIGHYGRLVFAMVAHHFLPEEAIIEWLTKDPDFSVDQAKTLLLQVESRDYNPPRRERILEWQSQQQFPILPHPEDPDCGNLYRNLKFPQSVYEHIQNYQEEKVNAQDAATVPEDVR